MLGTVSQVRGELKVVDLRHFSDEAGGWQALPKAKFKEWVVFYASNHLAQNIQLVNKKGQAAVWLTALFLAEAACMLVWLLTSL